MAILQRVSTGTYDGRPFVLMQQGVHIEGNEYVRRVYGYLLEFENDEFKYVVDYDPLLRFDPIWEE